MSLTGFATTSAEWHSGSLSPKRCDRCSRFCCSSCPHRRAAIAPPAASYSDAGTTNQRKQLKKAN
eukprot:7412801-Heterocapsa_arctica.AAC.1